MSKVRAKFNLTATKNEDDSMSVSGWPVYSDDPNSENKQFNEATPGGNFYIHIAAGMPAQENFEVGSSKEYYIDISEA